MYIIYLVLLLTSLTTARPLDTVTKFWNECHNSHNMDTPLYDAEELAAIVPVAPFSASIYDVAAAFTETNVGRVSAALAVVCVCAWLYTLLSLANNRRTLSSKDKEYFAV